METAWTDFCKALERRIGAGNMDVWVTSGALRASALTPQKVMLQADCRYSYEWIRDNLLRQIEESFTEAMGHPIDVDLTFDGQVARETETPTHASGPVKGRASNHLDRSMTFDNFVVGRCNEFAYAAACGVADAPGNSHNPLFIYGDAGLGKTHLLHAIGNRVASRLGGKSVLYMQSLQFLDSMIKAFTSRNIDAWRARFTNEVDVLLLDDVQFISGKDRTQEEVFYIFEAMRAQGKQIVITADQTPQEIGKLEPRLRTRFAQGLLTDILPPDVETMMGILANKADAIKLVIPVDVQYLIAQRVRNSVRDLEGVLNRLAALHSFYGKPITVDFIKERMGDVLRPELPPPNAEIIIGRVADHYHIRAADIKGDRRPQNIAHPRQLAMYLCRQIAKLSFPEIGRAFERDNSTVQYACKKVATGVKKDPNLRAEVDMLEKVVRGT